jgi:hypothetical protein
LTRLARKDRRDGAERFVPGMGFVRRGKEGSVNIRTLDTTLRQVAAISRRGSFCALGGAVLTAGFAATAARAGNAGKKGQKRCKRQRGQCRAFLETFCELKANPGTCEEGSFPCCEHFARCNAGAGITCLFEAVLA